MVTLSALLKPKETAVDAMSFSMERGIETEANITGKDYRSGKTRSYYAELSFFDKPLTEGGKLYLTKADVLGALWNDIEPGQKVQIYYLPENPEENVILKMSTDPENFAPVERYSFGQNTILLGFLLFAVGFIGGKLQKK